MRAPAALALVLFAVLPSPAWEAAPHRAMTRAALDSLPPAQRALFGVELNSISQTYCMLPDYYTAMLNYGFRAPTPAPQSLDEVLPFCLRPDREPVHSATWDQHDDLASLVFLYERILTALRDHRTADAARFAGVLAHFLEDSLSPPHAVGQPPKIHAALERTIPPFTLAARPPRSAGPGLLPAAQSILKRLYAAAELNRQRMPAMLQALQRRDQPALEALCLTPARTASELLADSLFTLFQLATR